MRKLFWQAMPVRATTFNYLKSKETNWAIWKVRSKNSKKKNSRGSNKIKAFANNNTKGGCTVTIFRLIKESAFGPDQIKVMAEAYEATLKALHLQAGTNPINELIAKKIIGIVQANEHDPKRICARTIKELGIQDLPNSQKFCEGPSVPMQHNKQKAHHNDSHAELDEQI